MKKKKNMAVMKRFKVKGKVINGNYKDLKIIDMETGTELPYVKSVTISLAVGEMASVNVEYHTKDLELDIEAEGFDENKEYGE